MNTSDELLEATAKALYENQENRCVPAWDQLGGATKSVWKDYVLTGDHRLMKLAEYHQPYP